MHMGLVENSIDSGIRDRFSCSIKFHWRIAPGKYGSSCMDPVSATVQNLKRCDD
jgi:hypothetical protein